MNARIDPRGRGALAALLLALGSLLAGAAARAQEPAAAMASAPVTPAPHAAKPRDASHWDLPRLFYEPRQRRNLDTQDRALHLGLNSNSAGTASAGPRFDGWVTGPSGTHAWVSGAPYVADPSGRLHATQERPAESGADEMESAQAQLDRSGVLIVHHETEGTVHLRVGEADTTPPPAPDAAGAPEHP